MIIFDECKYVTDIMRNGIGVNDNNAERKLFLVARYLIEKTKYKPSVIKRNLKKYANEYFNGLSDDIINREIDIIYNRAKENSVKEEKGTDNLENDESHGMEIDLTEFVEKINYFKQKKIVLYENEMKFISGLDKNLQELAFAFLVVHKFQGYKWTRECNSDIYKICHWDEKGHGKSQTTKNTLIYKLVEKEVISFYCKTNKAYSYNKSWIAKTFFTVLINEDNLEAEKRSPVWKTITNYDDVLLYWRLYQNDKGVKLCGKCGAPIADTGNSKKFCSNCALENIRESKKRSKEKSLKSAS